MFFWGHKYTTECVCKAHSRSMKSTVYVLRCANGDVCRGIHADVNLRAKIQQFFHICNSNEIFLSILWRRLFVLLLLPYCSSFALLCSHSAGGGSKAADTRGLQGGIAGCFS